MLRLNCLHLVVFSMFAGCVGSGTLATSATDSSSSTTSSPTTPTTTSVTPEEECEALEAEGVFQHNKRTECGCALAVCNEMELCFQGDCCNPAIQNTNDNCGCSGPCPNGQTCQNGTCCDPTNEDSTENCGCGDKCELGFEVCAFSDQDGRYTCQCSDDKVQHNIEHCAKSCDEPIIACSESDEICLKGQCECDPTSVYAGSDEENCGCDGPCPPTAKCIGGACSCENADQVLCDGECIPEADCFCDPQKHQNDSNNCGCMGPCSSTDFCEAGQCKCDPIVNANNATNCVCKGPCDEGLACIQGVCSCPPSKLNDVNDCGCHGPCPTALWADMICNSGQCVCPPGTNFCQPAGNISPDLETVDIACAPPNVSVCVTCKDFCAGGSLCKSQFNGDIVVDVYCDP